MFGALQGNVRALEGIFGALQGHVRALESMFGYLQGHVWAIQGISVLQAMFRFYKACSVLFKAMFGALGRVRCSASPFSVSYKAIFGL